MISPRTQFVKNNHRGQFNLLLVLGLFLVVIIILLTVLYALGFFADQFKDIMGCQLSIEAAGKLNLNVGIASRSLVNINCPRTSKTLTFNDVFTKHQYDPDKLKHALAEQMRACWYETGEGKFNPYSTTSIIVYDGNCLICSEIKFDNSIITEMNRQNIPKQLNDFGTYFMNTEMGPGQFGPSNITYGQYINDYKLTYGGSLVDLTDAPPSVWLENSPAESKFTQAGTTIPIDNLLVMWIYQRRGAITTWAAQDYSTLDIVPASKIGDMKCGTIYN